MFSRQKCFKTGVYRTNGLVNNWKFRITLKKIYSLIEIPQFDQSNEANLFDEPSGNAEEQLEIIWQGKVFSQYEIEYYGVRENCSTDLQKSYHNTIKSSGLADRENRGKIFTYTTADNYAPDDELSMAIQISRTRVEQEDDFESMFIMADLASEVVLFTIRWNSKENMLLVYPDFNSMAVNPYYKEIQGDSRQMYHFGIQNLSSALKRSVSRETVQIQDALMAKLTRLTLREELSKDNFSYPENHQLQFLVLLEVISGENFSYDNTHVRFTFDLPVETKIINGFIDGCTHSSWETDGRWQYSHCHELMLKTPENFDIGDSIKVYFEVISIDAWKRERLLGNAFLCIPLKSQVLETSLKCVKVENNKSFYDKLEAFLVGGRRKVNLKEFFGQNDSTVLNRYGSRTEMAGTLDIKCQIIQQHRPQIVQLTGMGTKKHSKFRANVVTIEELLNSYQRARERLEEVVNLKY
ncbi:tectonic-like complex member Mks1 [Aedes albopictus]|uniref:Meckel syndrome type 1 protein n=1 Tax=Aedes albopictus TaxID=7160 RepID=A0ABM1YM20_AEDAL|nr:Meckel syndrome type 1 protein homolog [Aedes albopictus]